MAVATTAVASPYNHSLSLQTGLKHDTNLRMSATDPSAVTKVSLSPKYRLSYLRDNRQWSLATQLDFERSSDETLSMGRQDPKLGFDWRQEYPRGSFGFNLNYDEDSTRITEEDALGQNFIDGTRRRYSLGGSWSHELSERLVSTLGLNSERVSYDVGAYRDYINSSLGWTLSYELDERWVTYSTLSASRYLPDDNTNSDSSQLSALLGLNYEWSELWTFNAHVGRVQILRDTGDTAGWNGQVSMNYQGERLRASLLAGRVSNAGGTGGYAESDQLKTSFSYEADEYTNLGLDLSWRENRSLNDKVSTNSTLWVRRELDDDLSLRFSYLFKQNEVSGSHAEGDVWSLTLNYAIPEL
jgi:hypothetical protein